MNTIWIIARKESAQMLRSQRGMLWLLAFSGLLSAFSLLLVSTTELSLLDNAQVVYMMAGTVLAAGALLAVILGSDTYAGEKERATLVPLLCAPVAPDALLAGKAVGMLAAWGVMFAVATPYLWAVGASGQNLGAALFYLALFGTPVVLGFGYLAMALSARTGSFFGIPAQYGHIADAGRKSAGHRTRSARHCRRTHLGRDQPVCRSAQHLR
ncbi:MAG: ABC transporter permease [Syntrophales bacterium]|jgi:ABC-type transport system involved in multi-copper enzyme maturation permease subunit|nr:ABC transporter permease [Syntrophales bacterium]